MKPITKRSIWCCAFALLACAPAKACFDLESPPPSIKLKDPQDIVEYLTRHLSRADWQKILEGVTTEHLGSIGWDARNDEAVARAYLGDYKRAFEILQLVEERHPGRHRTAANIGTLCELRGHNEEALRWIAEGIRREPQAQNGSEWLHLRILQAKIAIKQDPRWLETHSVSGLEFGDGATPTLPAQLPAGNGGAEQSTRQIENALRYQLHERLEFTPRHDAIVADLLSDFANLIALRDKPEMARGVYELAWSYGPTHPQIVRQRIENAGGRIGIPHWLRLVVVGGLAAFGVFKFNEKRRH